MTETIVPPRMSRIEKLMANLEAGPRSANSAPSKAEQDQDAQTFSDARQLILDLLGMSEKPVGERIYAAACAQIEREYGGEPNDLRVATTFAKRWLPDCFPATDEGQVPFARAVCESLITAAEAHLSHIGQPVEA